MSRIHPATRRVFLMQLASASAALSAGNAEAATKVEESDETAIQLGYKHDTNKVDAAKYPSHTKEQKCNNCQFWQGAAADEWAGCSMFGRKHIKAPGWCLAYRKV
jgi:High potential iron-sulfur protein